VILSAKQTALSKVLIYFVQVSLSVMGPNNPFATVARFVSFHPTVGSACPFHRTFYESVLQRLLSPVMSFAQLAITLLVMEIGSRLYRGRGINVARWVIRPLQALMLAVYTPLAAVAAQVRFPSAGLFVGLMCVAGQVLDCRPISSGSVSFRVITAQPAFECAGPLYDAYFSASLAIVLVYIVGCAF
jgi:hypothetical protein